MDCYFEKVNRFKDTDLIMPQRKTKYSAGYDMAAAEDIIIPPYSQLATNLDWQILFDSNKNNRDKEFFTLNEINNYTKVSGARPTLVSTGMKCKLPEDCYLELSVRSSCPLKYWLIMGNSVGIIDSDYYCNPDNDGEIFFQIINLSTVPIKICKGDIIGQGIIKHYLKTDDDVATGDRVGGFGSTSNG